MSADHNRRTDTISLERWAAAFLTAKRAEGVAPRTHEFYRVKLSPFLAYCGAQGVSEVEALTAEHLRGYLLHLEEKGHNVGGIHAHFRTARAFLRWYEAEVEPAGWRNPARRVKAPKLPEEPLDPVPLEDVEALLGVCGRGRLGLRDRAIILTLLDTGARAGEMVAFDLADLDLAMGTLLIRQGKGGKARQVFVGPRTRKALRAWLKVRGSAPGPLFQTRSRERLDYDGLREIVRRRAMEAGIKMPGLHSFRRAFAINMLRNGADLLTLQRLMGHANQNLLQRYAKQTAEDLRAVHGRASPVERLGRG